MKTVQQEKVGLYKECVNYVIFFRNCIGYLNKLVPSLSSLPWVRKCWITSEFSPELTFTLTPYDFYPAAHLHLIDRD